MAKRRREVIEVAATASDDACEMATLLEEISAKIAEDLRGGVYEPGDGHVAPPEIANCMRRIAIAHQITQFLEDHEGDYARGHRSKGSDLPLAKDPPWDLAEGCDCGRCNFERAKRGEPLI